MHKILDLGNQPPSNSFLTEEQLGQIEAYYPLKLFVCDTCWLVQLQETKKVNEIFIEDYAYYSSESPANVSHAKAYCEMMLKRFPKIKTVLEIGSNDGYMLRWFKDAGCDVSGIDPAAGPAKNAWRIGVPTYVSFFSDSWATQNQFRYDLICGINVLNHQPDINDFVSGLNIALAPEGYVTFEFPHLMSMIEKCQFDTIYHEHLNYYSLNSIDEIFRRHGLYIFDVDELPEHGGSLRIYASNTEFPASDKCREIIGWEIDYGVCTLGHYKQFTEAVNIVKNELRSFICRARNSGSTIVAYGAAAKANTLINSCRFNQDDIQYIADRSPHKIGKFLPGSHIPVRDPRIIQLTRSDFVLITAWNLKDEIMQQLDFIKAWGGKFIIPIPELEVI